MSKELENKATMLQVITCLNGLLDRANHDEYLSRIGKKEALKFLEENQKYADIIKSNLQRLESIDNANPSEALEEIGNIDLGDNPYKTFERNKLKNVYNKEFNIIKQYVLKAQEQDFNHNEIVIPFLNELAIILGINDIDEMLDKIKEQEKVLEILFEKRIDLESFYTSFIEGNYDYNFYDIRYGTYGLECLTEEEFELVKRWNK